ncbi:FliH/SctL family protein [Solimicrobium silvestre]|uniref:Flagellar assembly protein FliH n=1 Tax=Solimicrobium silvestre TaxID=2099400 RepID=A0A2S9H1S1_9BURK|nr:FliH/SctL family protein [Solimicrobium silvestre]PRC93893.1 Flagellar biosynthesis/type III secretory pathway protein [Solimicrobium silvestre]
MVSIIRSPAISEHKHKLSVRRNRSPEKHETDRNSLPLATQQNHKTTESIQKEERANELASALEQTRLSIMEQFKEEAAAARELGRQRGLREGRVTGIEESKQSFANEIARIKSIAEKLPQALESGIHGMEDALVSIAFEAVCKILGTSAVTREGIKTIVQQAAANTLSNEQLVVRLQPNDFKLLQDAGGFSASLKTGQTVKWVADKKIVMGGCMIETATGELDARLETQVQALRTVLVKVRDERRATINGLLLC